MEPRDDDRVRPIPIETDEQELGAPGELQGNPRESSRPWLPLLIAIGAVVVVVGSVSVFGALRFEDPEPADVASFSGTTVDEDGSTTTATTLPPRLEELLPGITDRLTMVTDHEGEAVTLLWDPSFRIPKAIPLEVAASERSHLGAALFDRGGRFVALERCDAQQVCDLHVGLPADVGTKPDVEGSLGFTWHASEVGRLAWVQPDDDGYTVYTATANPLSKSLDDVQPAFTVAEPIRLVQWDAEGFVVNSVVGGARTSALLPDGESTWTAPGMATTATDAIVAIVDETTGWSIVERGTGTSVGMSAPAEELLYVTASESAELIARLSDRSDEFYSLTVTGGSLSAPRIVTIEREYEPLGFTDDGTYFLFLSRSETVVFVDWNRGSARRVSAPDGFEVIGIDVG
jgi:hypothetical protein